MSFFSHKIFKSSLFWITLTTSVSLLLSCYFLSDFLFAVPPTRTLIILQSTDQHGAILTSNGGMCGLNEQLHTQIKQSSEDHVLCIDCGDLYVGSPEAAVDYGQFIVQLFNQVHRDVFIPGNHEFDYGVKVFNQHMQNLNTDHILAANLVVPGNQLIKPWALIHKAGFKIAVIGLASLQSDITLSFFENDKIFLQHDVLQAIKKPMAEILECSPDLIILACHAGFFESDKMIQTVSKAYPEIDLILEGHIHVPNEGQKVGLRTCIAQAGAQAQNLLKITFSAIPGKRNRPFFSFKLITIPHSDKIPQALCAQWEQVQTFFKRPICTLQHPVNNQRKTGELHSSLSNWLNQAILDETHSEVFFNAIPIDISIPEGPFSEYDLFFIFPYNNFLVTSSLNLQEIQQIMIEQFQQKDKDHILVPYGLSFNYTDYRKGIKSPIYKKNGMPILPHEKIKIAISSYHATGANGRFPYLKSIIQKNSETHYSNQIIRDLVRQNLFKSK